MADDPANDVYDDPDNGLADKKDEVSGGTELPDDQVDDLSQSIYNPEKDPADPRGDLQMTDPLSEGNADEASTDQAADLNPDSDAQQLGDMEPKDSDDDSES